MKLFTSKINPGLNYQSFDGSSGIILNTYLINKALFSNFIKHCDGLYAQVALHKHVTRLVKINKSEARAIVKEIKDTGYGLSEYEVTFACDIEDGKIIREYIIFG